MTNLTQQTLDAIQWVREYQHDGGTMNYHHLAILELADALTAANAREAALRAELELINDLRNRASDALDVCAAERDKWKGYYKRFGGRLMSCANCDVDMCGQEEIIEAGAAIFCCTQCAKDALL